MISHFMRENRDYFGIMDARLERLLKHSPADKICDWDVARGIEIFGCLVNGYYLTFMMSHNPYGTRCFLLDDALACALGFGTIERMREVLPLRKSLKFVSVQSLRRAINRYAERAFELDVLPKRTRKRARSSGIA